MTKLEHIMSAGCGFALVSVPVSLWMDFPVLFAFIGAFVLGGSFQFLRLRSKETKDREEQLFWHSVNLRVAAECGWDRRDYIEDERYLAAAATMSSGRGEATKFYRRLEKLVGFTKPPESDD